MDERLDAGRDVSAVTRLLRRANVQTTARYDRRPGHAVAVAASKLKREYSRAGTRSRPAASAAWPKSRGDGRSTGSRDPFKLKGKSVPWNLEVENEGFVYVGSVEANRDLGWVVERWCPTAIQPGVP